jgi:hypothetical protein
MERGFSLGYLRHEFTLAFDPQKATVSVIVLGWFELCVESA